MGSHFTSKVVPVVGVNDSLTLNRFFFLKNVSVAWRCLNMMTKTCPSSDCYFFFQADFIDNNCLTEHPCVRVCICIYAKTQGRKGRKPSI